MLQRTVKCGLIQGRQSVNDESRSFAEIQSAMFEKHLPLIEQAGAAGVQILCLQEIFNGPYFCPSQSTRWYDAAESIPGGPPLERLSPIARSTTWRWWSRSTSARWPASTTTPPPSSTTTAPTLANTARTTSPDKRLLGEYFFRPGNLGYPVFRLSSGVTIGVYICYDRHFPEGARLLGLHGRRESFSIQRHRRRPLAISLETRAARARRRQRLLHGLHQPRRHRGAVEHRQVLWPFLFRRSPRPHSRRSERRRRRAGR